MDFLMEIFKVAPDIVKWIIYVFLSLLVFGIVILMLLSSFKMYKALDKENQAFKLSETNARLNNDLGILTHRINELTLSSDSLIHFFGEAEKKLYHLQSILTHYEEQDDTYKNITEVSNVESGKIIKDFLNLLSSEISRKSKVRVSLWGLDSNDEDFLIQIDNSSNFYRNNTGQKRVNIHNSIIGRAYRTNKKQFIYNVEDDPDWKKESDQKYNSIIAIKLTNMKNVLSLDFSEEPDKSDLILIEFAVIILTYFFSIIDANKDIIKQHEIWENSKQKAITEIEKYNERLNKILDEINTASIKEE